MTYHEDDEFEIFTAYQEAIQEFKASDDGSRATGKCPFHDDKHASFSVELKRGFWKCHAGCGQGNLVTFRKRAGVDKGNGIVATYDYHDEGGNLLYQVVRLQPKSFRARRKNADGDWTWTMGSTRKVLYKLPNVLVEPDPVVVVEGEKDADNLRKAGANSTTCPFGAGKWDKAYAQLIAGRTVVVIADNDEPGRLHMLQVARSCFDAGCKVKVIAKIDGVADKGDVSDWITTHQGAPITDLISMAADFDKAMILQTVTAQPATQRIVKSIEELAAEYSEYIDNLSKRKVTFGLAEIDKLSRGLVPGEVAILVARAKVGKCVAANCRIMEAMSGEVMTMEDFYKRGQANEDMYVWSLKEDKKLNRNKVVDFIDNGTQPVYTIVTRSGRNVTVTWTHPFLTMDGWRRLSDLQIGDHIAAPRIVETWGTKEMPRHEITMLAYIIGDGCTLNSSVQFTKIPGVITEDFTWAAEQFGVKVKERYHIGLASDFAAVLSKGKANPVIEFLRLHDVWGRGSHTKEIPGAIHQLTRDGIALFLNRLFATDGSICNIKSRNFATITYASVSHELIQGIQHLLLRFGILSKIRSKYTTCNSRRFLSYELHITDVVSICKFIDDIGIYGSEELLTAIKAKARNIRAKPIADLIPKSIWKRIVEIKGNKSWAQVSRDAGRKDWWNWEPGEKALTRMTVAKLSDGLHSEELREWATSDIFWDSIVSITPAGESKVYDLTIADNHNFVVSDVIVHNSMYVQNLTRWLAQKKQPTLFLSLEQPGIQVLERHVQLETEMSGEHIEELWRNLAERNKMIARLGSLSPYCWTVDKGSVALDEIPKMVEEATARAGQPMSLVIVDYLGYMNMDNMGTREYDQLSNTSRAFKAMAKEISLPLLVVAQAHRGLEGDDGDKPITVTSARGSGVIEESTDILLGMYRPKLHEEDESDDMTVAVQVVVCRKGRPGEAWYKVNRKSLRLSPTEVPKDGVVQISEEDMVLAKIARSKARAAKSNTKNKKPRMDIDDIDSDNGIAIRIKPTEDEAAEVKGVLG